MTLLRTVLVAALLTTTGTAAFAKTPYSQPRFDVATTAVDRAGATGHSWCLDDYVSDRHDCGFASYSQCAETAAGGLGECSMN